MTSSQLQENSLAYNAENGKQALLKAQATYLAKQVSMLGEEQLYGWTHGKDLVELELLTLLREGDIAAASCVNKKDYVVLYLTRKKKIMFFLRLMFSLRLLVEVEH